MVATEKTGIKWEVLPLTVKGEFETLHGTRTGNPGDYLLVSPGGAKRIVTAAQLAALYDVT